MLGNVGQELDSTIVHRKEYRLALPENCSNQVN